LSQIQNYIQIFSTSRSKFSFFSFLIFVSSCMMVNSHGVYNGLLQIFRAKYCLLFFLLIFSEFYFYCSNILLMWNPVLNSALLPHKMGSHKNIGGVCFFGWLPFLMLLLCSLMMDLVWTETCICVRRKACVLIYVVFAFL